MTPPSSHLNGTVGIIGLGRLGSALAEGFLKFGNFKRQNLIVWTRHPGRHLSTLRKLQLKAVNNISDIFTTSKWIFLCIPPQAIPGLLTSTRTYARHHHVLISASGTMPYEEVRPLTEARFVKIYPTILCRVGRGVSLITRVEELSPTERENLLGLMAKISRPMIISDEDYRLLGDLTSCGPALYIALLEEFIRYVSLKTASSKTQIRSIVFETLEGLSALLNRSATSSDTLLKSVQTPKGITGAGISVIQSVGNKFVSQVLSATVRRDMELRREIIKSVRQQSRQRP